MSPWVFYPLLVAATALILVTTSPPFARLLEPKRMTTPQDLGRIWTAHEQVEAVQVTQRAGEYGLNREVVYGCPHCHGSDFIHGPAGGYSVNVECRDCHLRWNAHVAGFRWEFLGYGEGYNQVREAAVVARRKAGLSA